MLRVVGSVLVAALLAPGTAWGKELIGTAGRDTIVGTAAADFVKPRPGADTVAARGGNDRIASPADGAVDRIGCGEGLDLALVELLDRVASDCETLARQLSRDRTSDFLAQHETQVEPHSLAVGRTIVAAFQSGRFQAGGGAAAIGWAASADAGRTWRSGTLPTQFPAVSDPVVAYDAAHTTWLIAYVAVTGTSVDVYVSRSRDGRVWQAPIAVAVAPSPSADYDKEWIVCDNGVASRFRGRCYVSYLDTGSTTIVTRSSSDGGRTWGAPVGSRAGVVDGSFVNGALSIVRPNGDLLVLHTVFAPFGGAGGDWVASVRSIDGGATFAPAARVASLEAEDVLGMRAPPLVTAAVDARGTVRVVWADCRFQEDCRSNDLALTTSSNGTTWTPAARPGNRLAALHRRDDPRRRRRRDERRARLLHPPAAGRLRAGGVPGARRVARHAARGRVVRPATTVAPGDALRLARRYRPRRDGRRLHIRLVGRRQAARRARDRDGARERDAARGDLRRRTGLTARAAYEMLARTERRPNGARAP